MKKSLEEIATIVQGKLHGKNISIEDVKDLHEATKKDITFATDEHLKDAQKSKAGAILVSSMACQEDFPMPLIYVENPRVAFATLLTLFAVKIEHKKEISEFAYIAKTAHIGKNVTIMPFAFVDENAVIFDEAVLYPHVYIGSNVEIGTHTVIYPNVTIREDCKIGSHVIIHSSAVIGADGFGFTTRNELHTKVPQIGNVIIEDDVEIGAGTTIDRATINSTIIGRGTKIDNLVHIAHNCRIGKNNIIVAQTGISGSTIVGDSVTFGGQTGTVGHIKIGSNALFAARSGITSNTPDGAFYGGFPARPHKEWLRLEASLRKVPEMLKRMKKIEEDLKIVAKDKNN